MSQEYRNQFSKINYITTLYGNLSKSDPNDWLPYYKMYVDSMSYKSLAEYMGISVTQLFRYFKKFGFKSLPEEITKIRNKENARATKLERYGNPHYMDMEKTKITRDKNYNAKIKELFGGKEELILDLYLNKKMGSIRVAREVGIKEDIIRQWLKKQGILRSYKESMEVFSENVGNYINVDFFGKINTEEKAYWLGFIYADGNINKKENLLTIGLKSIDRLHLKKFGDIFGKKIEVRKLKKYKNIQSEREVACCRVGSKHICRTLIELGIKPRKTYIEDSFDIDIVPTHLLHHFLRGLFDGDGSVGIYETGSSVKSKQLRAQFIASDKLTPVIQKILMDRCSLNETKIIDEKYISLITYGGNGSARKIFDYLYKDATIYLERKYDIFTSILSV